MRMKYFGGYLLLSGCLLVNDALACSGGGPAMGTPAELVEQAPEIYLARVESAQWNEAVYDKTAPRLGEEQFPIQGAALDHIKQNMPEYFERVDYKFTVLETIHGPERNSLKLRFRFNKDRTHEQFWDYDLHANEKFWDSWGGRTQVEGDCTIAPVFEAGQIYLILPDAVHIKGYEWIRNGQDLWLNFVRYNVSKSDQKSSAK